MQKRKEVGFTGTVEKLKLQDVIQMACIAGTTSTIAAVRGNQKGYSTQPRLAMSREVCFRADSQTIVLKWTCPDVDRCY